MKMINCKACNKEIASRSKVCPHCGVRVSKKFYKRPLFWIPVTLLLLFSFGMNPEENLSQPQVEPNPVETSSAPTYTPAPVASAPTRSMSQENALEKALQYLNYSSFSKSGLVEQLEYEGFSHEDALYAVDKCGADWNEQAAIKAQDYLNYSSFSRSGLIEQLEYEGFTYEQAIYGVNSVEY